jgi:predicted ATPase with chaperone activity
MESMIIVGLPDAQVLESRERVLAALSYVDEDQKVVGDLFGAKEELPPI